MTLANDYDTVRRKGLTFAIQYRSIEQIPHVVSFFTRNKAEEVIFDTSTNELRAHIRGEGEDLVPCVVSLTNWIVMEGDEAYVMTNDVFKKTFETV